MTVLSQKDFATAIGRDKSYITRLKQAGHLVMTEDGRVDVEPSLERLQASTGNTAAGRAHLDRWDEYRRRNAPQPPATGTQPGGTGDAGGMDLLTGDLSTKLGLKTKAENLRKLTADADRAQMERDVMRGKLIDRDEVLADMATAVGVIHNAVIGVEDRLAPLLGVPDDELTRIRALIRDEMEYLLATVARELGQLAKENPA